MSPWTRELAQGDRNSMRKLGRAIRTYHDAAIAPYWKSIGTHVSADHAHRGEALARHGVDRLLSTLHPRVRWAAPVLQVLDMNDRDLYLDGRGIELQPSAFCWQVPTKLRDPELKPILVYPIHHAPGILRQSSLETTDADGALGSLLGSTRAAALEAAVSGCTTTELAKHCKISPAAASHQATVLREAGLITTRRWRLCSPRGHPARHLASVRPRLRHPAAGHPPTGTDQLNASRCLRTTSLEKCSEGPKCSAAASARW